ncbi:MAG: DUF2934 domain-containing protein [Planctomycetes bacterium]|nr:DUF2934 domain-containing protein [Planctomycetota bacterium]
MAKLSPDPRFFPPRTQPTGPAPSPPAQPVAGSPSRPSVESIARRAYELHLERGGEHGHDQEDWFRAEKELLARRAFRDSER